MRIRKSAGVGCAILLFCAAALAQPAAQPAKDQSAKDKTAIEQVLRDQEAAWNNGDIDTFMHGYQNSPETTFIGKNLHRGYGRSSNATSRTTRRGKPWASSTFPIWRYACSARLRRGDG